MDTPKVPQNIVELLAKVHFSEWTLAEKELVDRWLSQDPHNQSLWNTLQNKQELVADLKRVRSFDSVAAWNKQLGLLQESIPDETHRVFRIDRRVLLYVAAAIVLIVGFLFTHLYVKQANEKTPVTIITPGKNQATLTLADGTVVPLQSTEEGLIVGQDLRYESGAVISPSSSSYTSFEMNTPRGGQYKLTLPDGSRVWMNAETRLAYTEDAHQRVVEMDGEAYFEVKKQWVGDSHLPKKPKPFTVNVHNQSIRVLGTHFNVKGYKSDAKTYTTLVEGSVQVRSGQQEQILIPGEQSILAEGTMVKKRVDVEAVVAWQKGSFVFNAEELEEILQQVGRWYNVEFVITSERLKSETFEVMVPRFEELKSLLDLLQKTGKVKFKSTGRIIYVTEK